MRQHGHLLPPGRERLQLPAQRLDAGSIDLIISFLDAERDSGVVDILRSEAEMHELLKGRQAAAFILFLASNGLKLFLDEILYRLDIVVGHRLYLLDATCIGL